MPKAPISQRFLLPLIAVALMMPVAVFVIMGISHLLLTMGDEAGSVGAVRVAVACGGLWVFDLICLVVAVAMNSLCGSEDPPEEP